MKNSLEFMTHVLANTTKMRRLDVHEGLQAGFLDEIWEFVRECKTSPGQLDKFQEWSQGSFLIPIASAWEKLADPEFMKYIGLSPDGNCSAQKKAEDREMCELALEATRWLTWKFGIWQYEFTHGPLMYMSLLLSPYEKTVDEALSTLQMWWVKLQELEQVMLYTDKVKDLWLLLEWPDLHWVRKAFVMLEEVDFKFPPSKLETLLQEKWGGMKQTLANELVNGRMKRRHLYHPNHSMTESEVWHTQLTSSVLEEFGRKGPVITPSVEKCRLSQLPADLHDSSKWENSLGALYDDLGGKATWINISHQHRAEGFFAWKTYIEDLSSNWRKISSTWPSLLAVPVYVLVPCDRKRKDECM